MPNRDEAGKEPESTDNRFKVSGDLPQSFNTAAGSEDRPESPGRKPGATQSFAQVPHGKPTGGNLQKEPSPASSSIEKQPPTSTDANSFTAVFEGINAFTRDLAEVGGKGLPNELSRRVGEAGALTKLFDSDERPSHRDTRADSDRTSGNAGRPGAGVSPRGPVSVSGGFTEAFQSSVPEVPSRQADSFTKQFSTSLEDTLPKPGADRTAGPPIGSGSSTLVYQPEGVVPSFDASRSAKPIPKFLDESDAKTSADASSRFVHQEYNATRIHEHSAAAAPRELSVDGNSEYSRIIDRGKLGLQQPSTPNNQAAQAGAVVRADMPVLRPAFATPQDYSTPATPGWSQAPAPSWPSSVPPGSVPSFAPPVAPPAAIWPPAEAPRPQTSGDRLVAFLPSILALTVVNFLGLLAVLIILFATRK